MSAASLSRSWAAPNLHLGVVVCFGRIGMGPPLMGFCTEQGVCVSLLSEGHCPICGMALEPEGVVEEVSVNPELALMQHRFWVGAAFAVPLVLLDMGAHFPGFDLHRYVPPNMSVWLEFVLASPVVLWCAWPFFERGWASLKSRHLNMFTLIALGVGVGYAYSVIATVAPGLFPPAVRGGPDRWHRARRPQRRP
jgi:hypothetical protein